MENVRRLSHGRGVTVARPAIAWVIAQDRGRDDIVAQVGARRPQRVTEAMAAAEPALTGRDLAAIEAAVPADAVAGDRHAAPLVAQSERER